MNYEKIKFKTVSESDGTLTIIERDLNIPFKIKRVFQIYKVPDIEIVRANHASINTFFVLQILAGQAEIELDNGFKKCLFKLNRIDEGILVPPMTWMKTMHFSKDAILQVYASEEYFSCKYIEDYNEFKERVCDK